MLQGDYVKLVQNNIKCTLTFFMFLLPLFFLFEVFILSSRQTLLGLKRRKENCLSEIQNY